MDEAYIWANSLVNLPVRGSVVDHRARSLELFDGMGMVGAETSVTRLETCAFVILKQQTDRSNVLIMVGSAPGCRAEH